MKKWTEAAKRRKEEIDAQGDMARDLTALLDALPPGQRKQLLADEVCGAIIRKHTREEN